MYKNLKIKAVECLENRNNKLCRKLFMQNNMPVTLKSGSI